jgi:tRNA A-37 threonylcarbamoyl transferase component Bud32
MVIYLEDQEEFDGLVRTVKQHARVNFGIWSFLNGSKTPNFTNHLEVVEHNGQTYLVKTSKFLSGLLYNSKSTINSIKGKKAEFLWDGQRQQHESEVLDQLLGEGVKVPERVFTQESRVLVLKYYEGEETKLVLRDRLRYPHVLADLSLELDKIHQIGLHGEPSTNNTFVFGEDSYWADFERFSRKGSTVDRARELVEFINSVVRHSYRSLEEVTSVVFENYSCSQVVDLARKVI